MYCERDRTTGVAALRMWQVATGATVKLADGGAETTFSPDGSFVYLRRGGDEHPTGALFVLPALGGEEPQPVLTGIGGPVTLSRDGTQMAFFRGGFLEQSIIIANRDGTAERVLYTGRVPGRSIDPGIAWSPDGTVIAAGCTRIGTLASRARGKCPPQGGRRCC